MSDTPEWPDDDVDFGTWLDDIDPEAGGPLLGDDPDESVAGGPRPRDREPARPAAPAPPEPVAPPPTERQGRLARRARQRRRRRLSVLGGAALVAGLLAVAQAASWQQPSNDVVGPAPASPAETPPPSEQDTLLLIRYQSEDGPAAGVTLLTAGEEPGTTAVVFIPEATLVDIPGFGPDRLGLAYQYGGAALVEASVENLLGVGIDHVAAASDSGLAAFLGRTGGLDLEVEERLVDRRPDGTAMVRFEPGPQFLDGQRLVEYWRFRQRGESELDTFPRQQLVWGEMLRAAQDPQVGQALVADGAPQLDTDADETFLQSLIDRLAEAQEQADLDYAVLPVAPFGAGDDGDVTYRPSAEDIEQLTAGLLAPSVPVGGGAEAVRVQVLNGVGTPGIGQQVDERLEGAGFRIVLTDNARNFNFDETRILVYTEDERSLAAAEQVRQRLGVGTIQVSRQPQSVVDLTIVVGADFAADADADPFPPSEEQSS